MRLFQKRNNYTFRPIPANNWQDDELLALHLSHDQDYRPVVAHRPCENIFGQEYRLQSGSIV